jgi:cell division protein FtsI (penicillin-binding protein 3)
MEGDLEASRQLLKQFGIAHDADFSEYATETIWGEVDIDRNTLSLSPIDAPKDSVPNVCGYGLRDAIFRLEQAGLCVKTKGAGVVVQQSKKPGTSIHRGDTIMLTLASNSKK